MKTKLYLTIILLSLFFSVYEKVNAQAPAWQWAKSFYGTGNQSSGISTIGVDDSGNVYAAGSFMGTLDLDPGPDTLNVTTNGYYDIFISKFDKSGNFMWGKTMGGSDLDIANSIAVDDSGNSYITGFFTDTIDLDPGPGIFSVIDTDGGSSLYVLKLNSQGDFTWAKTIWGDNNSIRGNKLILDALGDIYMTGIFTGTVDFNPDSLGVFNITVVMDSGNLGTNNTFILVLDTSGNFEFATSLGGGSGTGAGATGMAVDDFNNIYLSGSFIGTSDFDPDTGIFNLTSSGFGAKFYCKLNNQGHFVWANSINYSAVLNTSAIEIDNNGNVYHTGYFTQSVDFDPGPGMFYLTASGISRAIFISKLDSSGNFVWAKSMTGPDDAKSYSLILDDSANIYITGDFDGTLDFDPGPGTSYLAAIQYSDIFVSKFDSTGNFVWVKQAGGYGVDRGGRIALNSNGNLCIAGTFDGLCSFDSITIPAGIYIAQLSSICSTLSTLNISSCSSYISPSGNYNWTSSGTYLDTIPNATGCDSVITINLTINAVNTSVTQNGIVLTANAAGATYQWLDCNNGYAIINGAINQNYTATANGSYAAAVTQNGCTDTSACYTVTGVGINEIRSGSSFEIFPNPVHTHFTIVFKNSNKITELSVKDIAGKIIYKSVAKQKTELNAKDFAAGVYIVQIQTDDLIETKKLIVQK